MVTETQLAEARLAAATAPDYAPGSRSQLRAPRADRRHCEFHGPQAVKHSRRKIGKEYMSHKARQRKDLHKFLTDLLKSGNFGRAQNDPAFARMVLQGAAEGWSGNGFPAAAGGVDVSAALTSVRPGIRKIKKRITSKVISKGENQVEIELPKSGYLEMPKIRITGEIEIKQGATAEAITLSDIRNLVREIKFELSSTVVPKSLTGLQCDIIDNLDCPVVTANANVVPTSAELSGAANSTIKKPFVLELQPRFTVSDQNLYGIPYLGVNSTVPRLVINLNNIIGKIGEAPCQAAANGPEGELVKGKVEVDGWRVDLPAPVAPSTTTDAEGHTVNVPGEGLWAEASYLLKSRVLDSEDQVSAGLEWQVQIPIGPMYTRLILLAYVGHVLDQETGEGKFSILEKSELGVQEATVIESREPWMFSDDYRSSYYKQRPSGVYVHSGIDQSGTDEDLWVTQDLGNFTLTAFTTGRADGEPGTKYEVIGQSLAPISKPGLYA